MHDCILSFPVVLLCIYFYHFNSFGAGFHPTGEFFLGVPLGVLWIPCVGPILGAVLALVVSVGNTTYGASMLFVYSIGMSPPYFPTTFYGI
jgi:cytochrome c biogenesis protein CcdA